MKNNTTDVESFKAELKVLLAKYNAYIGFSCDDSSDTYGITGDKIVVGFDPFHCDNGGEITLSHNWQVDKSDL